MPLDLAALKAVRAKMTHGVWDIFLRDWDYTRAGSMWADGDRYVGHFMAYNQSNLCGIVALVNAADEMIAEIERLRVLTFADHTPDDVTEAMLRSEVLRLRAELDRVTPYLAAHGACGYGFTASTKTGGNE